MKRVFLYIRVSTQEQAQEGVFRRRAERTPYCVLQGTRLAYCGNIR